MTTNVAKAVELIRDAFQLFIPNNMILLNVQSTNRKIEEVLDDLPEEAVNDSTRPYLRTTTVLEIYALIGLMFFRGLLGLKNHDAKHLFSEKTGHHVFGATMSKNRYALLTAHLCFDDQTTRREC